MKAGLAVAAIVLALLNFPAAANEDPKPAQGVDASAMISSLQRLQDQVAAGIGGAREAQAATVEEINNFIRENAGRLAFTDQNLRSAIEYVFIGGDASGLRAIAFPEADGEENASPVFALAKSILDKGGKPDWASLESLAATNLGRSLSGTFALARASNAHDLQKNIVDLELARTAGLGTIVEEAALRALAGLYLEQDDLQRFLNTVSRYVRAFPNSPYSSAMYRQFVAFAASTRGYLFRDDVSAILQYLPPKIFDVVRGEIVRASLVEADLAAADYFRGLSPAGAPSAPVKKNDAVSAPQALYDLIARNVAKPTKETVRLLSEFPEEQLSPRDLRMLSAAREMFSSSSEDKRMVSNLNTKRTVSPSGGEPGAAEQERKFSESEVQLKALSSRIDEIGKAMDEALELK